MDLKEHAFYLRKLAELEARVIKLERHMTEVEDKVKAAENAAATDPERAVRKFVILN